MPDYPKLDSLMRRSNPRNTADVFAPDVIPYLIDIWLEYYDRFSPGSDIVEVSQGAFDYLFDITHERLLAAWCISQGHHLSARDKTRMAGHPKGGGKRYHRGHAIAHSLGGGTDINLVPQLGFVNTGAFRALEIEAVMTPGSFYFSYWIYAGQPGQVPVAVEQGLLIPGKAPVIRRHTNV